MVSTRLKNFIEVKDISTVPRFTFIRYLTQTPQADSPRVYIGGKLLKVSEEYVLLGNAKGSWSVPRTQFRPEDKSWSFTTVFYRYKRPKNITKTLQITKTEKSIKSNAPNHWKQQYDTLKIENQVLFDHIKKLQKQIRALQTTLAQHTSVQERQDGTTDC